MELTGLLLRAGAARPHVLAVTAPGAIAVRLAAEEQLRRRGWPSAMTPADADILLVAGHPGGALADAVEAAWRAMPVPRARAQAAHPGEVAVALEAARVRLGDRAGQQAAAARETRRGEPAVAQRAQHEGHGSHGHGMGEDHGHGGDADYARGGDGDHGHRGDDHGMGGHDDGGMRHGHDMGDMDMPDMDMPGMALPGGLAMARRGADRDGLKLDQLHLPLGPVLPDWPAGLVLHCTLQGDVVQRAEPEVLGGGGSSFWDEPWHRAAAGEPVTTAEAARRGAAAHLDSLGRFLGVAGWDAAATTARRLRGDVLAGTPSGRLRRDVRQLARRVARSRVLAWLTGRLGVLTAAEAAAAGVSGPAAQAGGDVTARYRRWCADLDAAVAAFEDVSPLDPARLEAPRGPAREGGAPSAGLVAVLPGLLAGTELAAARLIVASLDPDLDQLPAAAEVSHGH